MAPGGGFVFHDVRLVIAVVAVEMHWLTGRCHPDKGLSGRLFYIVESHGNDELWTVRRGEQHPERASSEAVFYINGDRIYRTEAHPDGPSSVPYYRIRGRKIYPDEGYPTGRADLPHFYIRYPRRRKSHKVSTTDHPRYRKGE
jgi:hypothetical protein